VAADGDVEGVIANRMARGNGGFGYEPALFVRARAEGETFAQDLSRAETEELEASSGGWRTGGRAFRNPADGLKKQTFVERALEIGAVSAGR